MRWQNQYGVAMVLDRRFLSYSKLKDPDPHIYLILLPPYFAISCTKTVKICLFRNTLFINKIISFM